MKNKGAITVFMVLITTAMLTLAGVIIDMSRILLAYYTISSVSESATRSMMANYDATLVGDYGLYAIEDTDENKAVFLKYVKRNLNAEENNQSAEKTFSFLKFNNASLVESETGVKFKNRISDDKVFEKQIKEYQNPRAVVIATDEVISKFMDILTDSVTNKMLGKADAAKDSVKKVSDKAKVVNEKTRKLKLVTENPKLIAKVDLGKAWKNVKKSTVNSLVNKSVGEVFNVANKELFKKKTFSGVSGFDDAVADVENELKLLEQSLGNSENELSQIKATSDENQYNSYSGSDVSQYVDQGTSYNEVSSRIS
ncbi:MAG: pilus assembly protein, partial [Clostridia bacterium]|nr:pilus assembly protein [Clostridia bacterium]